MIDNIDKSSDNDFKMIPLPQNLKTFHERTYLVGKQQGFG